MPGSLTRTRKFLRGQVGSVGDAHLAGVNGAAHAQPARGGSTQDAPVPC
jgi:hypothetical protein